MVNDVQWTVALRSVAANEIVTLDVSDTSTTVRWLVLRQPYRPSKDAIRRLLEHRDLLDAETDATARDREVVALVPVDGDNVPKLEEAGHIFATLPTGVPLKLRLLLQADWLLNTGRDGLVNAVENTWQAEIIAQIPALLRKLVTWIRDASRTHRDALHALDILADVGPASTDLHGALARREILTATADALADIDFIPVHAEGRDAPTTVRPRDIADVPAELLPPFQHAEDLVPSLVFGGPVIDATFAKDHGTVVEALRKLGLLSPVGLETLESRWPNALNDWWAGATQGTSSADRATVEDKAATAVLKLMAALTRLTQRDVRWGEVPSVLTASGRFTYAKDTLRYASAMPGPDEELGAALREELPEALVPPEMLLHPLLQKLSERQSDDAAAAKKLIAAGKLVHPHQLIRDALRPAVAAGRTTTRFIALLADWARTRNLPDFLTHLVVVDEHGRDIVAEARAAVVADPFVEGGDARRAVFPTRRPVSASLLQGRAATEWRAFLESVPNVAGPLRLVELNPEKCSSQSAFQARTGLDGKATNGYTIVDRDFEAEIDLTVQGFASWLEQHYSELQRRGRVSAKWFYYKEHDEVGTKTCRWVERLEEAAWVPVQGGGRARPSEVVLARQSDDEPLADISGGLARVLKAEGVRFGTKVPRPGPLALLRARGNDVGPELATVLRDAIADAQSEDQKRELLETVVKLAVPIASGRRVPVECLVEHVLGGKYRSDLRGYVVLLDKVYPDVRKELERVPGLRIPSTTTGYQALAFLRTVWRQASEDRVDRDAVRVLPRAYDYLASGAEEDRALAQALADVREEIRVSDGRGWQALSPGSLVFVDDLYDEELRKLAGPDAKFASPNHLADVREAIPRIAGILGLPLLSAHLRPEPVLGVESEPPWLPRLTVILRALGTLESRVEMPVVVNRSIEIFVGGQRFPRQAAKIGDKLHVTEDPGEFDCDAAALIVSHYRLEQRGTDVPQIIKTVAAIDKTEGTFRKELDRLVRQFQLEMEHVEALVSAVLDRERSDARRVSASESASNTEGEPTAGASDDETSAGASTTSTHDGLDDQAMDDKPVGTSESTRNHGDSPGAGYPLDGADGPARAYNDRHPGRDDDGGRGPGTWPDDLTGPDTRRRYVVARPDPADRRSSVSRGAPSDEAARNAVMAYERANHRVPIEKSDKHPGYDIESTNPLTGEIRRIEVKGLGGRWQSTASVYLTERQFRTAASADDPKIEYWLYVVDAHSIHAVPWRRIGVSRFFFYAEDWAELAESVARCDAPAAPFGVEEVEDEDRFDPAWWSAVQELRQRGFAVHPPEEILDREGRIAGEFALRVSLETAAIYVVSDGDPNEGLVREALEQDGFRVVVAAASQTVTVVESALRSGG